jgi:glycerol dehydrogenase
MSETTVTFAGYTIGCGGQTYSQLGPICSRYGKKAVVIGGEKAMAAAKPYMVEAVKDTDIEITGFEWFGGVPSYENADTLCELDSVKNADMVFACGGGKAIDTAKCVARNLDKSFFTFPAIAATCSSITAIAIMYYPSGVQKDVFICNRPAIHAFINLDIIASAPEIYLWAGIGDTLAKFTEVPFSARGHETQMAHQDALPLVMSKMTGDPLLQYGKQAMESVKKGESSFALEQCVLAITVTSGMVSYMIDSYKYNSNLAHAIFYGMTLLPQIEERHLHGEVVSYGVLCMLMMDKQTELLDRIYGFMKSIGLPTKLADMEVSWDEMGPAIENAAEKYDIEVSPYKITKALIAGAIQDLEAYNQSH